MTKTINIRSQQYYKNKKLIQNRNLRIKSLKTKKEQKATFESRDSY